LPPRARGQYQQTEPATRRPLLVGRPATLRRQDREKFHCSAPGLRV